MSFFSFLKRNKESYSLVFNVGSGSISGGIVKFTEKKGVNLVYYNKEEIPFQQELSVLRHLDLMKVTLAALTNKLRTEGLKKIITKKGEGINIDRAFYIFSSPWSTSQTKTIKVSESKPFRVTESYLNRVIDEQEKQFIDNSSHLGKIIEKKIIQVKINGYVVTDIYNKYTRDLEISVYFTVVPEAVLDLVEKTVSKNFNIKNSWCHSSSLAVFSVIRNLFPQKEDFIYVDVNEEITDIFIIKDDVILGEASFPFGSNHFTREVSSILRVPKEVSNSMIKMHCLKNNDELAALKMAVIMDKAARKWLNKISEILNGFKAKMYVSDSIFLVSNNDRLCFFREKLQKQDFDVFVINNNKLKSPVVINDIMFRLVLMFLDNLYKI